MFLVCTCLSGNTRFQKTSYSLTNKVLRNSLEKNPETFHQLSSSFQLEGMSTSSTPSKSASLFCLFLPRLSLSLSLSLRVVFDVAFFYFRLDSSLVTCHLLSRDLCWLLSPINIDVFVICYDSISWFFRLSFFY